MGHFESRKFSFGMFTSFMIIVAGAIGAKWIALQANLPMIVGGLLGSFTIYAGGNVLDRGPKPVPPSWKTKTTTTTVATPATASAPATAATATQATVEEEGS